MSWDSGQFYAILVHFVESHRWKPDNWMWTHTRKFLVPHTFLRLNITSLGQDHYVHGIICQPPVFLRPAMVLQGSGIIYKGQSCVVPWFVMVSVEQIRLHGSPSCWRHLWLRQSQYQQGNNKENHGLENFGDNCTWLTNHLLRHHLVKIHVRVIYSQVCAELEVRVGGFRTFCDLDDLNRIGFGFWQEGASYSLGEVSVLNLGKTTLSF